MFILNNFGAGIPGLLFFQQVREFENNITTLEKQHSPPKKEPSENMSRFANIDHPRVRKIEVFIGLKNQRGLC